MENEIEPNWTNPLSFFFRTFAGEKVILGEKPMNWWMIIKKLNKMNGLWHKNTSTSSSTSFLAPVRPLRGRLERVWLLSAGSIPFGHSTSGYSHSPPLGTEECDLRNLNYMMKQSFFDAKWNWTKMNQSTFVFFRNFADEKVILGEKPMNWRMIIQTT